MRLLVLVLDAPQDQHRRFDGRLVQLHWKRRASAGSFSKYFLYSDQVVAATVRSSPRARAGFSRFAASPRPPGRRPRSGVRFVDEQDDRFGRRLDLVDHPFSRFSNSPLTPRPPGEVPCRARGWRRPSGRSGTSPSTTRSASPSTTAVLLTPASPTTIGLFFPPPRQDVDHLVDLRSRPKTGSISPRLRLRREVRAEAGDGGAAAGRRRPSRIFWRSSADGVSTDALAIAPNCARRFSRPIACSRSVYCPVPNWIGRPRRCKQQRP